MPREIDSKTDFGDMDLVVDIEFLNEAPDDDRAILTGAIKNVYNSLMEWYGEDEDYCLEQIKGVIA